MKTLANLFFAGSMPSLRHSTHGAQRRGLYLLAGIVLLLVIGASVADPYLSYVATSWLIFGLAGLSLDLVWGRGGFLSLCQSALYGIGGYVGSIVAINFSPLTGDTLIWSLPAGALAGALLAGALGAAIFYGRMGPLQGTILTYACTLLLWTASVSLNVQVGAATVGGDNGLSGIPNMVLGFGADAAALTPRAGFICVLAIAVAIGVAASSLMRSPFGRVIDCIRMNVDKAELLGYDVRRYQTVLFALSGGIAGIAGALYGAWSHYLSPSIFSAQEALMLPIYVLVGGLGTLIGPFMGAALVGGLSFWLGGGVIGGQTTLVMGVCLILLVLFLREGLLGALLKRKQDGRTPGQARVDTAVAHSPSGLTQASARVSAEGVDTPKIDLARLADLRAPLANHSPSMSADRLVKAFGGVVPVREVSLRFSPGRVRCLIGPNGAGKSSLLRCCTGVYALDSGRLELNGRDMSRAKPFERVRAGLGVKMQVAQVFDAISVRENLWIAAYAKSHDADEASRHADDMLRVIGQSAIGERLAGELSHGEQQWLDIGMVLCSSPDVILLDEPAAGMTGAERRELCALIRALASHSVVIVVEHDMDFVRELDAHVTVLHRGEVFAEGDIEALRNDDRILDIYLGRRKHVLDI
ncbi:ABC transporter permease subunit [Trinickia acidisoli]|uniref:ABC transporter permease subunit n=1 Tax=Trinickia acidisoli TaxID=2767482 RepID=UPI001A8EF69C|nr:ATP-binding cassette domain-containing protein [Trinickia acidisoli]